MDILILCLSIFFGIAPMVVYALAVRAFDRFEKEPWLLLIATFIWGAVIAAGAAFIINTALGIGVYFFTGSETATELSTGVFIAPVVEESLKGLAVLAVFLFFYREFDSVLDGILYASMVGFGFAATENIYYIYARGYLEAGTGGSSCWPSSASSSSPSSMASTPPLPASASPSRASARTRWQRSVFPCWASRSPFSPMRSITCWGVSVAASRASSARSLTGPACLRCWG